jgi:hypothetical protein
MKQVLPPVFPALPQDPPFFKQAVSCGDAITTGVTRSTDASGLTTGASGCATGASSVVVAIASPVMGFATGGAGLSSRPGRASAQAVSKTQHSKGKRRIDTPVLPPQGPICPVGARA